MDDVEMIAAILSPNEQAAICGIFLWPDPISQEIGEDRLYNLGLMSFHGPTSLGLAVRRHMENRDA